MDSNPDTFDRGEGEKTKFLFFGGPLFLGDLGKPHDLSLVVYDSAVSVCLCWLSILPLSKLENWSLQATIQRSKQETTTNKKTCFNDSAVLSAESAVYQTSVSALCLGVGWYNILRYW